MNSGAAPEIREERALYPIGTVANLTGVPPITLRAWERRYGLIKPVRKPSGHRLYTREDIDLIHKVVALVDGGLRIGQVRQELGAYASRAGDRASTVWDGYRNGMIGAIARFDENRLEQVYGDALALHPIELVTRELLTPLLMELGERWQSREGSIAEEHFFAFFLRNKLGARFHHRHREAAGRRILAACLEGEHHELGLLLFALAAHEAGFRLVLLGANMPLDGLAAAAVKAACEAIVLSASVLPESPVIVEQLAQLVNESSVPVFVGGTTSVACCDAIVRAGAEPLGADIGRGLKRLSASLDSRVTHPESQR